jgi:hypothetical protein
MSQCEVQGELSDRSLINVECVVYVLGVKQCLRNVQTPNP